MFCLLLLCFYCCCFSCCLCNRRCCCSCCVNKFDCGRLRRAVFVDFLCTCPTSFTGESACGWCLWKAGEGQVLGAAQLNRFVVFVIDGKALSHTHAFSLSRWSLSLSLSVSRSFCVDSLSLSVWSFFRYSSMNFRSTLNLIAFAHRKTHRQTSPLSHAWLSCGSQKWGMCWCVSVCVCAGPLATCHDSLLQQCCETGNFLALWWNCCEYRILK